MSELASVEQHQGLLNVTTGELLEPTLENAAIVLDQARAMKEIVNGIVSEATAFVAQEAARQGTKTLRQGDYEISLSGGTTIEYDATELAELLREAGCPEERIDAAVVATITYKVDRAVLRQLAAANPDYKAAIELSSREVEKPFRAATKTRRHRDE